MRVIRKSQLSLGICLTLFIIPMTLHAQVYEADAMMDWLNLIRTEKFDHVLPQAMRDNNVDMWIHVMGTKNTEEGHLDPLRLDLGGNTGYFIFTDRGGEGIERAAFGRVTSDVRASGAYEITGRRLSEQELRQFVSEFRTGVFEFSIVYRGQRSKCIRDCRNPGRWLPSGHP